MIVTDICDPDRIRRLGVEGLRRYVAHRGVVLSGPKATQILDAARVALRLASAERAVLGRVLAVDVALLSSLDAEIVMPYTDDLARRMLLPALFSAAAGYVTLVAINGTEPLFPISGAPPFNFLDLAGAAVLGVACGFGSRAFARLVHQAKVLAGRGHPAIRIALAGLGSAALFAAGRGLTGESLVLGSGYLSITWALQPSHTVGVVLVVFILRAIATAATVGGGGVGGLFIPLVVQGALIGRAFGGALRVPDVTLFPVLGMAAFLGAGYRVPLAAVVFVAETTGRPGFIVPGLIAAAAAQVVVGRSSVSSYQHGSRAGHLERRFALPITSALRTDAMTVPSDATIAELYDFQLSEARLRVVPVVDGPTYIGMAYLADAADLARDRWATTSVVTITRTDAPVGDIRWTLGDALQAMEGADADRLAILDQDAYVGIVTTGEILKLDEILEAMEPRERGL